MTIINNTQTNLEINTDRIISNNENGIVSTNKKCWSFVPNKYLSKEEDIEDGLYYNKEDSPELKTNGRQDDFLINPNDIDSGYREKAQYKFGVKLKTNDIIETYDNAASISEEIDLGVFSYITLSSEEDKQNCSVEYYIINGNVETPILPEGITKVEKEKLFLNLPTRFIIDKSSVEPTLFEDNIQVERSFSELTSQDFEQHDYYLSYIPGGDNNKIIPTTEKIKIKIIIRKYNNDARCLIKNVTINKFGGALEWN